jgi:hypothetical protein
VLVSEAAGKEGFDPTLIILTALTLEIRATITFAWPGGIAGDWAFIPDQPEPAETVEDDFDSFLGIAGHVRVFDAEHKRTAGVAGIEPIEQSGACSTDMEEPRGTRRKSNPNFHVTQSRFKFKVQCSKCKANLQ